MLGVYRGKVTCPRRVDEFLREVLSKFATQTGLKLALRSKSPRKAAYQIKRKIDEIKVALRELGLSDDVSLD